MAGNTTTVAGGRQPELLTVDDTWGRRRIAVMRQQGSQPGVFWLPGFNSVMTSSKATALAEWAANTGRGLTRFDYSGHGASDGRFEDGTIGKWLADAHAVYQTTIGRQIMVGSSMGGYIALLLAQEVALNPVKREEYKRLHGLVLIAPAWNMTERLMWAEMPLGARAALERDGVWHRPSAYGDPYPITKKLIEEGRNHLIDLASLKLLCPLRILHGRHDADVPFEGSAGLLQAPATDARLIEVHDGDHRLAREQDIALLLRVIGEMA
jgi:pimeloyl-ACP methyl ester carboxylesterase